MGTKRPAEDSAGARDKKQRTKKQWRTPRNGEANKQVIQPGDSGIWGTCNKGKERACVGELRDLFAEYAELLYGVGAAGEANNDINAEPSSSSIENEINAEVAEMKHPEAAPLFTPIRIDVQCVVFFKTTAPIEPVSFVKRICEDAMKRASRKRTRWTKRLSPMTLMGRASLDGLEKVALTVLEPHFHQTPLEPRKFAIRPTLRNHNLIKRDGIIKLVAQCVGSGHQVDLKNYDLLIVVEVFQNICGVSVVDDSFERLKRFNLAEIYDPTPITDINEGKAPVSAVKAEEGTMEVDGTPGSHALMPASASKPEDVAPELDPIASKTASMVDAAPSVETPASSSAPKAEEVAMVLDSGAERTASMADTR
ncbi:uncharacterized protein LTR77_003216 [Saxophila tyrrhenica]|uniref:THUMP domain-containing protein n=1 Tax=Saxophila tyrrhenica TaxID=1690608 RepID=A0AAV9PH72_9PEZI|nr:hypothetical protein LTR77_003216 [Saxophila tyrrhenica]